MSGSGSISAPTSGSSSNEATFFDDPSMEQAGLAPEKNTITFSSAPALGRFVQSKEKEAEESGCYLVINHVVDTDITKIKNALRGRGLRKQIRLTYENTMELLITKFIPGLAHEITSGLFFHQIASKICAIPGHTPASAIPVGASEFRIPGQRSKQGDGGFMPATRRSANDWPSIMLEVGYSESLPYLHQDASWWLIHSLGQTRMVLIFRISWGPPSLRIEVWELVPNPGRVTRTRRAIVPKSTAAFDIAANGSVTPAIPLRIPYKTIFDDPHEYSTDILWTPDELSTCALAIFGALR